MKEKILELLNNNLALTQEEMINQLALKNVDEFNEFSTTIQELVNKYEIYITKRDKYMLFDNSHYKKGNIEITRSGNGFLLQGEDDIFVTSRNLNGALNGDTVVVEVIKSSGRRSEGKVINVLVRALESMVGTVYMEDEKMYVKASDRKINIKLAIIPDHNMGAVDGDVVRCKQIEVSGNVCKVEITEVIANHNDPDKDMLLILAKYDIETQFNDQVIEESESIPTEVDLSKISNRHDLREEFIFTIDGDDTRDIDDAISIKWDEKGYELGVHIADVAHYVRPNTALDDTALNRGTSVYLVDRVVPMLPKVLSNGICSLNPNVDRLAMSVVIKLDNEANIIDYEIFESIINSKKQCTYGAVNEVLEKNIIPEGYELFAETLQKMNELALKLRKKMEQRGYIEFESDEVKFKLDEENKIIEIIKREQKTGEKLIENFMILANECIATYMQNKNMPSVYRVHDLPSPEKIKEFIGYVGLLGYDVRGIVNSNASQYSSLDVQALMRSIHDKVEFPILSDLLLRSMKKAIYSPQNTGHFGLGSKCYTHFTSPIRRYPDTTIHRLLKMVIQKEDVDKISLLKKLTYVTELSSAREQASVECEREVDDMKMAEYMEAHVGEEFKGMIVSVHPFGMFVKLDNLVEGLIAIGSLEGHYTFIEESKMLMGKKYKFRLGDSVLVKCVSASKDLREIDFEVIINGQASPQTEAA